MIEIIEEIKEPKTEQTNEPKKKFTIFGFTIWRLLVYFVVYSFMGFVVETIYGMITKGVIESRQSFLYGPFCAIYGLGAVVMILCLQYFNKNNNTLFIGGCIVGNIVEYLVSLIGELVLHVKWWDYSDMPFNLNGRICLFFSIFWGILAVYLMSYINPRVDKIIDYFADRMSMIALRVVTVISVIFLVADCSVTVYALGMFYMRKVAEYDLNVANKEIICEKYDEIYGNENMANAINQYFGDEKMIKTFPNLKIQDEDGNIIYFNTLVGDIKPYYYKFNSTLRGDLVKILKHENWEEIL